jgi:hypothetical protein
MAWMNDWNGLSRRLHLVVESVYDLHTRITFSLPLKQHSSTQLAPVLVFGCVDLDPEGLLPNVRRLRAHLSR